LTLQLMPLKRDEAFAYVRERHRHHKPPTSYRFAIGVHDGETLRGVIIVGRPVARHNDDGFTAEVTRCCTDGAKNAPSKLYAAAWRAARAMGFRRMITYTLAAEPGTSLIAAGYREYARVKGRSWNTPSRPRTDSHPTGDKTLWELTA
jgi:hypothetical protein